MTGSTLLLAPDKFKGSASAAAVAAALARGIQRTAPDARVLACPIADGGDGTVDAALAAGFDAHSTTVTGPTGQPREASWALSADGTDAVVELAQTVGLQALPDGELAPRTASTRGLGELILAAARAGARTITVGLGGSASTDAGVGLLQGLGAHLLTADGTPIAPGLEGLASLARVDLAPARDAVTGICLIAASDVASPLLGADGAAAVFGPQKGLTGDDTAWAEDVLTSAAQLLDPEGTEQPRPGAGAAGGTGFALHLLGAEPRSGAQAVLELSGFEQHLREADLVLTGEGALDQQTLQGKGPAAVAQHARKLGIPVIAAAGAILLDPGQLADLRVARAWDLRSRVATTEEAIARTEELLEEIGREIGASLEQLVSTVAP